MKIIQLYDFVQTMSFMFNDMHLHITKIDYNYYTVTYGSTGTGYTANVMTASDILIAYHIDIAKALDSISVIEHAFGGKFINELVQYVTIGELVSVIIVSDAEFERFAHTVYDAEDNMTITNANSVILTLTDGRIIRIEKQITPRYEYS